MVDNKATALKETNNEYQLKIYYSGDTISESGSQEINVDILDGKHFPWLFKYCIDGKCVAQYAHTAGIYNKLSQDLGSILDAVIVNAKQREAIGKIVDKTLYEYLCEDFANENDTIPQDYPIVV